MSDLLHFESRLMQTLLRIADVILLNLLTIVCSLPVLTIGASMAALFGSMRDLVRGVGGSAMRIYFTHWKANAIPASKLFAPILLASALLALNGYLLLRIEGGASLVLWALFVLCAILVASVSALNFLLYVNFENTLRATYQNALKISIAKLPQTLLAVVMLNWPWILFIVSPIAFLFAFALFLLAGVSAPVYGVTRLFQPVMEELAAPKEQDADAQNRPNRNIE